LNSVETRKQLQRACREIPAPVLTIWAGAKPIPTLKEYEDLGVRIILYPTMTANPGLQAAWELLNELREKGNSALEEWSASAERSRWGRVGRRTLLGTEKIRELEERYIPAGAQRDYAATWGHKTAFSDESMPPRPAKRERTP